MITSTKLTRNLAKLMLVAVFFSITSCVDVFTKELHTIDECRNFKKELHTIDECRNFKKGDTIFTKEFYSVKKCVVLNNYPSKELIEVRDLRYTWDISILSYDEFRFK